MNGERVDRGGHGRWVTMGVALVGSWYASLLTHELGHALAAIATGAQSVEMHLPLVGFSRTDITGGGHPLVTTAAGFAGGAALPLTVWACAALCRLPGRSVLAFWAGCAMVMNGAYLAGDSFAHAGDGAVLAR